MARKQEETATVEVTKSATEKALEELDKDYGKGSVIHGGELQPYSGVISTGSIGLDIATGIGGVPQGKVIEIYGWESSGKSTISQTIIGNAQKKFASKEETKHLKCILVDGENSLDEAYAKKLGVNMDDLFIIQLDEHGGEGAYNKVERLVEAGDIGLVVYDSYNSLQPKSVVIEGEVGDSAMGKHARMMGQVVQKANYLAGKYNCTFIFLGQMREKIGVMFGSPETTQGGNALKFYAHMRIEMRKTLERESTAKDAPYVNNKTKAKVVKNKMAPPFKIAEFDVPFGKGIDREGEIVSIGSDLGIINKSGSWYSYNGNRLGQGEAAISQLLTDNPELALEIETKIRQRTGNEN